MTRGEIVAALNRALREVSGQGVIYSHAVAGKIGLAASDLECLDVVVMGGAVTAGALARATGLTSGAITGVIDRLERAGFARREDDPADRRKVLVRAEPAALQRFEPLYGPMAQGVERVMAAYDDDQLALLLDFLGRAHQAAVEATAMLREPPPGSESNSIA
jgi:DNA-binding MarR family transcriptional regulator